MPERIIERLAAIEAEMHSMRTAIVRVEARTVSDRVWNGLMKLAIPVSLVVAGKIVTHEVRLTRIEESRFTSADALAAERRGEEAARRFVAESETRIAKEIAQLPPEWMHQLVKELKVGQDDIKRRLTVLETKFDEQNK